MIAESPVGVRASSRARGRGRPRSTILLAAGTLLTSGGTISAHLQAAQDSTDSLLAAARSHLADQLPVTASAELARHLSTGQASGSEAVLLAAAAYADYAAWEAVRRLLEDREWESDADARQAGSQLARAYLELGAYEEAIAIYDRLLPEPDPPESPGSGDGTDASPYSDDPIHSARARARAGRHAESSRAFAAAATGDPDLAPWLRLSALQQLSRAADSTGARALAETLLDAPVPRDSVRLALALILFAAGDVEAGISEARRAGSAYAALAGSHIAPALLASGDTALAVRALDTALGGGRVDAEVGAMMIAVDPGWRTDARVAESDLGAGRRQRGKRLLARALEAAPENDQPALAESLSDAYRTDGDPGEALRILGPWLDHAAVPGPHQAEMWLTAGLARRSLGQNAAADDALATAAEAGSPLAAFLLADARHDAGELEAAREWYVTTTERFPTTWYGELSLIRTSLIYFGEGAFEAAERGFEAYRARYPDGHWYPGALYWTGRTHDAIGDSLAAADRYAETIDRDPLGYYALLAGRRTGVDPWTSVGHAERTLPAVGDSVRGSVARAERLERLGWRHRARQEIRRVVAGVRSKEPEAMLAAAGALNRAGWTYEGITLAWRARRGSSGWDAATLRAIYPMPYRPALERAAAERGLEADLVAAVIRRESMYDTRIVSAANAIGLMQLLPRTAAEIAGRAGLGEFHARQLIEPEVNLKLGTRYLADMLDRFDGSVVAALATYNAGPHRWGRWKPYLARESDPELVVERIPFRETREYVRAITALRHLYARLWGL